MGFSSAFSNRCVTVTEAVKSQMLAWTLTDFNGTGLRRWRGISFVFSYLVWGVSQAIIPDHYLRPHLVSVCELPSWPTHDALLLSLFLKTIRVICLFILCPWI